MDGFSIGNAISFINHYNLEIILGLIAVVFILLIINIIGQIRISNIKRDYDALVRGIDVENLEDLIIRNNEELYSVKNALDVVERKMTNLDSRMKTSIRKVGMIRYDAFDELGSEQSFSIACLDEENTGYVYTSIFGRDYSSNYLKPIEHGEAQYKLSVEEMQAIDRAMRD